MQIPVWKHNRLHTELVKQLTREYFEASSEIVQANSFFLTCISSNVELESIEEEVTLAIQLAKDVVSAYDAQVKVGLSLGSIFSTDPVVKGWNRD